MTTLDVVVPETLPQRPLSPAEQRELRAREDVEMAIVLGTAPRHRPSKELTGPAKRIVLLSTGTVYGLEYDRGWSKERLQENADRNDCIERALDRLGTE